MKLSAKFEAVASKHLGACDLPNRWSHQHELTGVKALREVLGAASKTQASLVWTFFPREAESVHEVNSFTFYDARAKSSARTGINWKEKQ